MTVLFIAMSVMTIALILKRVIYFSLILLFAPKVIMKEHKIIVFFSSVFVFYFHSITYSLLISSSVCVFLIVFASKRMPV